VGSRSSLSNVNSVIYISALMAYRNCNLILKLWRLNIDFPFNHTIICFMIPLVSVYYEITRIKRIAFAPNCRTVSSVISDNTRD